MTYWPQIEVIGWMTLKNRKEADIRSPPYLVLKLLALHVNCIYFEGNRNSQAHIVRMVASLAWNRFVYHLNRPWNRRPSV
jgi:hypothetical protein